MALDALEHVSDESVKVSAVVEFGVGFKYGDPFPLIFPAKVKTNKPEVPRVEEECDSSLTPPSN